MQKSKKATILPTTSSTPDLMDIDNVVNYYSVRIKASAEYYEKYFIKRADRHAMMYELNHYYDEMQGKDEKPDRDRVKVPYPYSNVRQILAELYSGLPPVIVKPEHKTYTDPETGSVIDAVKGAKMLKESVDYVARRSNMASTIRQTVLDGLATGIGCTQLLAQKSTKVPSYRRVIYRDVLWDCTNTLDVYQSDWIACKRVLPLEDIKNNEQFNPEEREFVTPAVLDKNIYGDTYGLQYGVLWEIFDKKKNLFLVYGDGNKKPLQVEVLSDLFNLKITSDDFVVDWPFAFYIDGEMITKGFGIGEIYPIESQTKELDKTRTQQVNHRKRFNRKYLTRKGSLDARGMNQLRNPDDGTIIEVNTSGALDAEIMPLQDMPMSADVYNVDKIIQNDIQIISPLGPNSLVHGVGKAPSTLGESQIVEQSSNTRLSDMQKCMSVYIARVYKLTAQYIQQYWKDEDVLLVTGDGSKEEDWVEFSPEAIKGEYEFEVAPESMKDNSAVYRKQMSDAITVVGPILGTAAQVPGLAILVRKYLETFDSLKNSVDDIIPMPEQPQMAGVFGNMQGQSPEDQQLLDLINNHSEEEVLAVIAKLPQNEQQALITRIQELEAKQQTPTIGGKSPQQLLHTAPTTNPVQANIATNA